MSRGMHRLHPARNLSRTAQRIYLNLVHGHPIGRPAERTLDELVASGLACRSTTGRYTPDGYWQPQRIRLSAEGKLKWQRYLVVRGLAPSSPSSPSPLPKRELVSP